MIRSMDLIDRMESIHKMPKLIKILYFHNLQSQYHR